MKLIIVPTLFVSLFAFHSAYVVGAYDLQCVLDNSEQMTPGHVSNTIYINFENSSGDSEESDSVIKLDVLSGEAKQVLTANPGAGTISFTSRGENEDIEGAAAVNYSGYDSADDAHYTVMNAVEQETSTVSYEPGAIKVSRNLLQNGINDVGSQQANKPDSSQQQQVQQSTTPSSKVQFGSSVDNEGWSTKYGVIQLTITDDNVVLKSIRVNRGNCRMGSVGNRILPAKYKFGDMVTFRYMKCDRIIKTDIVADTGSWTFNS